MQHKTFAVLNGDCRASVTVRTETGRMRIRRMTAEVTLDVHEQNKKGEFVLSFDELMERQQFAAVWSQSEVEGNLGFEWPASALDKAAFLAACEAWLNLPGETVNNWLIEVQTVNLTPNDPDLLPPEAVSQKKERTRK
jgi:hypothetical protein